MIGGSLVGIQLPVHLLPAIIDDLPSLVKLEYPEKIGRDIRTQDRRRKSHRHLGIRRHHEFHDTRCEIDVIPGIP